DPEIRMAHVGGLGRFGKAEGQVSELLRRHRPPSGRLAERQTSAAAARRPVGLRKTSIAADVCCSSALFGDTKAVYFAFATSQSLMVLSPLPEANIVPSALNATHRPSPVCPLRVASSLPPATSQSLIVPSSHPEASVLPSGLKARAETWSACPLRVACSLPVATAQSLMSLATRRPSPSTQTAVATVLPSA